MSREWSDLLVVRGVYDKNGSPVLIGIGWGAACLFEYVNDGLYVLFLHADEQCDVAASQETAGAGDAGHAVLSGHQLFNHGASIRISDDGENQFHVFHLIPLLQLLKMLNV
jgi:hypothetical protein